MTKRIVVTNVKISKCKRCNLDFINRMITGLDTQGLCSVHCMTIDSGRQKRYTPSQMKVYGNKVIAGPEADKRLSRKNRGFKKKIQQKSLYNSRPWKEFCVKVMDFFSAYSHGLLCMYPNCNNVRGLKVCHINDPIATDRFFDIQNVQLLCNKCFMTLPKSWEQDVRPKFGPYY